MGVGAVIGFETGVTAGFVVGCAIEKTCEVEEAVLTATATCALGGAIIGGARERLMHKTQKGTSSNNRIEREIPANTPVFDW